MDSELQRLRFRVRQLEREVRALRRSGGEDPEEEAAIGVRMPAPLVVRRRVLTDRVGPALDRAAE